MSARNCPFCLSPIGADQAQHVCPDCDTTYHEECFEWNGACGTFGCPAWKRAQAEASAAPPERVVAVASAAPAAVPSSAPAVRAAELNFCDFCGVAVSGAPSQCPSCHERLEP